MTEPKPPSVEIIHRPNRLKAKVCGTEHGGPGMIAPELLSQAQAVVREYSEKYPGQSEIDLSRAVAAFKAVMAAPERCGDAIQDLKGEAREIMGQAATFGYPLLTRFARSLYDFCEDRSAISDQQGEFLKTHVDAMQLVVRSRLTGDGGDLGRELDRSLALASRKLGS